MSGVRQPRLGSSSQVSTIMCVTLTFSLLLNNLRASSPSNARRSPSPGPSSHHPSQWQRKLLRGERAVSPTRSVSPRPIPISPLVQRRVSAGLTLPPPFFNQARRGWVTPIGRRPPKVTDPLRRWHSLDTGLGDEKLNEEELGQLVEINGPLPDTSESDHDEVLVSPPPLSPAPQVVFQLSNLANRAERPPSRKDLGPSLTRSKAAQTIITAINSRNNGPRRSTTTEDESTSDVASGSSNNNKFVDRSS